MQPRDIGKSYDKLAERWNSDDFPRDNGIEQHNRALGFARKRATALDVGCGSSGRYIDLLLNQGFEVEGLDISERMIELARSRHPNVKFHCTDICEWELPQQYDFITAWDSIWHVPLDRQTPVLKKLLAGLSSGGVIIFTTGVVDRPSETNDAAMGVPMYHGALGIPKLLQIVDEARCVCRHLEYDQHPELHVYIIAQKLEAES